VPGPEDRYEGSAELAAALAQLGDREREVIALRYGGEMNGPEIAELLDITLANVQQIVSRSLRKLRTTLESAGVASRG
jgi:RNA polymerase sigma factor (sigma-70 family)